MSATVDWDPPQEHAVVTVVRNVTTRYANIGLSVLVGLVMLRFNVQHLGAETYGLWILAASVTTYFSVLDLGFGSAVVKFVAEYRAKRDAHSLNEVLSTMHYVFIGIGFVCYAAVILAAVALPAIFNIAPDQIWTGRFVLLATGVQVALFFPFSVYGGVINGFERYHLNNLVGLVFNLLTAAVNVLVLWLGYGLVELVACTAIVRVLPFWIYRRNAYAVFPELSLSRRLFRRERLRELTGFSLYAAVVDWSHRLTYTADAFLLGALMSTSAVALFAVAQRIADALLQLTHQIQTVLMPAIVQRAVTGNLAGQRALFIRATRFQLATAVGLCGAVAAIAGPLIHAWLGAGWGTSVIVAQLLALVVAIRAGVGMPSTVLQGSGHHRYVALVCAWAAGVNLVLSVPLIWRWGVPGMAVANVVAAFVCAIAILPRSCRTVGLAPWTGVTQIVLPAVWPAAVSISLVSWAQTRLPDGIVPVLATLGLGVLVYGAVFVLFGLDREERQWLRDAGSRIVGAREPLAPSIVGRS